MAIEKKQNLQRNKMGVLYLCVATYVMVYLCRLNFSSALLKISEDIGATAAAMGTVGSLFFIAYAIGQIVNGFIGDRVSPIGFILFAILGTGIVNICMVFVDSLLAIKVLWVINGYFQSVFWATLNRLLSFYFQKEEHHIASTGMSLSMVISYVLSWVVLGKALVNFTWQSYFLIPGVVAGVMLATWFIFARFATSVEKTSLEKKTVSLPILFHLMKAEGLFLICITCIFTGIVKEGIGLWAPVIFYHILDGNLNQSLLLMVFIPFGNFLGIMLSQKLLKRRKQNPYMSLIFMLSLLVLSSLSVVVIAKLLPFAAVFFIAAVSAMAFGCNSILLSYIPLSYAENNIVSTLIGLFNFCAYIGASISAYVLGLFLNHGDWQSIPILWACAGFLGTILILLILIYKKRKKKRSDSTDCVL